LGPVLELRIAGPGLDLVRRLGTGEPELVLGRDPDCAICLPDPQRNVSRRHLALWLHDGALHFRVLSVVNGVSVNAIEVAPGGQGVLPQGETLKLGEYTVVPARAPADSAPAEGAVNDLWEALQREAAGLREVAGLNEDDPFGDWGFESTFGPGVPGGPLDAASLGEGSLASFFTGLGMDPAGAGALTHGELEAMGRTVRLMVERVLTLHAETQAARNALRTEDRTMVAPPEKNPLALPGEPHAKLRYLFGGHAAAVGKPAPERALRAVLHDLRLHNAACAVAVRAAVEGTLKDFSPAALKDRLLGGVARLFESARAWDAYARFYAEESSDTAAWAQRLLDRHFAESYLKERHRLESETPQRDR